MGPLRDNVPGREGAPPAPSPTAVLAEQRVEHAVSCILTSPTLKTAAARLGISRKTLYKWLKGSLLRERLQAAARALTESALQRLQASLSDALDTLRRNLSSGNPVNEIRAAGVLAEAALRVWELSNVAGRLDALEAAAAARKGAA